MAMTRASRALLIFFWIAFGAFLAASIPHVAWFFSVYEPHNADGSMDIPYWFVSYGIALSIDVTTFLLSMTVAGMAKQRKSRGLIFSVWMFILILAALSWFVNGKYAIHFQQAGVIAPSPVTLSVFGYGNYHIADLNPIIASCFQVLAVAYTWIADKIAAGETPKTAEELEKEASELVRISAAKAQIAEVKRTSTVNGATGLFDAGAAIFSHAKSKLIKPAKDADKAVESDSLNDPIEGPTTDELEAIRLVEEDLLKSQEKAANGEEQNEETDADKTEANGLLKLYPKLAPLLATGQRTASIKQVIEATGHSPQMIANRLKDGTLKTAPRNDKLVMLNTLYKWLETAPKPKVKAAEEQSA